VQGYKLRNLCLVTVVYPGLLLVFLVLQKEGGRFKIVHIACDSVAIPRKKRFSEERLQALQHHGLHSSSSPLHDVHSSHQDDALHHIW
jgi:hypothetical protein